MGHTQGGPVVVVVLVRMRAGVATGNLLEFICSQEPGEDQSVHVKYNYPIALPIIPTLTLTSLDNCNWLIL